MLNVIKNKWYWAGVLVTAPMLGLAQSSGKQLTGVVKNASSFTSVVFKYILFAAMGVGVIIICIGLWNLMNKDGNPQANQGGGKKLLIGLALIAVPLLIGMATGEFFGQEANVEEVLKDPFS